jgi:hypothetical protein
MRTFRLEVALDTRMRRFGFGILSFQSWSELGEDVKFVIANNCRNDVNVSRVIVGLGHGRPCALNGS